MDSNEILEKIRTITADQLCLEITQVRPDANFTTELGADSLDIVELVMALEEAFGIEIPEEVADTIFTVEDAANFIIEQVKNKEN